MRTAPLCDQRHVRSFVRTLRVASLGVLFLASACFLKNSEPDIAAEPTPPTILRVQNQAFLDMTIYAFRNSQRQRLGQASGNSTTKLTIPTTLLFGMTQLRFQADPIGSNRQSVTQEISVSPGDEVLMIIPP